MKELLTCPICREQFKTLNSHIHFKHNLTTEEFLIQYPNTTLVSDSIKDQVSKTCKSKGVGKWMKGYEYPKWRVEKYRKMNSGSGNPFYGKQHSEKTKQKMSKNHADFTGDKNPLVKWLNKDPNNRIKYRRRLKKVWRNKELHEMVCKRNTKSVKKAMLAGNHNPYSNCKHGWFKSKKFSTKFYFQSSYERSFLEFAESSPKIKTLQKVPFVIEYVDNDGKSHNYWPDFLVNDTIVIEIKPESMLDYNNNRQKIEAGNNYCVKDGYQYKLLMETELTDLNKVL